MCFELVNWVYPHTMVYTKNNKNIPKTYVLPNKLPTYKHTNAVHNTHTP